MFHDQKHAVGNYPCASETRARHAAFYTRISTSPSLTLRTRVPLVGAHTSFSCVTALCCQHTVWPPGSIQTSASQGWPAATSLSDAGPSLDPAAPVVPPVSVSSSATCRPHLRVFAARRSMVSQTVAQLVSVWCFLTSTVRIPAHAVRRPMGSGLS